MNLERKKAILVSSLIAICIIAVSGSWILIDFGPHGEEYKALAEQSLNEAKEEFEKMSSGGQVRLISFLIIGLVIGLGVGYMIPSFVAPADDYDVIMARGTIIVGTNTNWPPFEMYNTTTDTLEGFDIDLANLVADYLGVTTEWIDMDFDNLVGACQAGTIDMIASATFITAARCDVLQPLTWYIRTNEVVVTKANSTLSITSLDDLVGYDVGVQTGTVEDEELSAITGMEATLTRYPVVETSH